MKNFRFYLGLILFFSSIFSVSGNAQHSRRIEVEYIKRFGHKHFKHMSLEELVSVLDFHVQHECGGKLANLGIHSKSNQHVKVGMVWRNLGLRLAEQRGEKDESLKAYKVIEKEGYSLGDLKRYYLSLKGVHLPPKIIKEKKIVNDAEIFNRMKFYGLTFEELGWILDDYVDIDLAGNMERLTSFDDVKNSSFSVRNLWANYAYKLAERDGELESSDTVTSIVRKKGYSAFEMLNHYRVSKGFAPIIKVNYEDKSLEEILFMLRDYVKVELEDNFEAIPTVSVEGAKLKIHTTWAYLGLRLAADRGELQDSWTTNNIFSKKGYSKKELKQYFLDYFKATRCMLSYR